MTLTFEVLNRGQMGYNCNGNTVSLEVMRTLCLLLRIPLSQRIVLDVSVMPQLQPDIVSALEKQRRTADYPPDGY